MMIDGKDLFELDLILNNIEPVNLISMPLKNPEKNY